MRSLRSRAIKPMPSSFFRSSIFDPRPSLVVLAFFERLDARANLRLRFHFVFPQQKRPRSIGIFQPRVASSTARIGHRFYRSDARHEQLILASALELNRRNARAFDARAGYDDAMSAQEGGVVRTETFHHALGQPEVV